jgi:hypothetical protein
VRHVVLWVEQSRGGRHGIKKDHTTRKHTDLHAAVLPVRAERARILKNTTGRYDVRKLPHNMSEVTRHCTIEKQTLAHGSIEACFGGRKEEEGRGNQCQHHPVCHYRTHMAPSTCVSLVRWTVGLTLSQKGH